MTPDLLTLRERLDSIDTTIIEALAERQRLVLEVAASKASTDHTLHDSRREQDLLTRVVRKGKENGLDPFYVTTIFRSILENSVRSQQEFFAQHHNPGSEQVGSVVVAYQGTRGSYSELAAQHYFSSTQRSIVFRGYGSFASMLEAVLRDEAHYAVLPIENTTAGSINESYDLLIEHDLYLVGEQIQQVDHCLLGLPGAETSALRRVFSHPQALAQCSVYLASLENCRVEAFSDTALAAERVLAEGDLAQAAIASEAVANRLGLSILVRNLANRRDNFTRMVIVGRKPVRYDARIPCKTSVIFAAPDDRAAGALLPCLDIFAKRSLSLLKLESRPRTNAPWQYHFYVDFQGNPAQGPVAEALSELRQKSSWLKVLGAYPIRTVAEAEPAEPLPTALNAEAVEPASLRPAYGGASPAAAAATVPATVPATVSKLAGKSFSLNSPYIVASVRGQEPTGAVRETMRQAKEAGAHAVFVSPRARRHPADRRQERRDQVQKLAQQARELRLSLALEIHQAEELEALSGQCDMLVLPSERMDDTDLLHALSRWDRPVILRRPALALVDEWLAASELLRAGGNEQIVLCETGVRGFDHGGARTLDLRTILSLQRASGLLLMLDPSYIADDAEDASQVVLQAQKLGIHAFLLRLTKEPPYQTAAKGTLDRLAFASLLAQLRAP